MPPFTEVLSRFAAGLRLEDVPDAVRDRAVLALRDLLGVALSQVRSPLTDRLVQVALLSGAAGDCVLPGRAERISAFWGAAVMGASTHHAELDDGHRGGHVHPGVTTIPALLMDAQRRPTSGSDVLAALIASYEVSIRVGEAISPSAQYERGFHIPGLVGTLGSTVAVARMRGAGAEETEAAVGTAVLGPLTPFAAFSAGAAVKDLYGGWPAAMGILGNDLVAAGIPGPSGLLEHPMGWFTTVGASRVFGDLGADLHETWRMLETYVKVHAACSFSHSAIDAALELHEPSFGPDDIAEVSVATHIFADRLDQQHPRTPQGARFSIPWLVAAALLKGRVTPEETGQDALADQDIVRLAERVRVMSDAQATERHLRDDRVRPARVELRLADGRKRTAQRDVGRGGPEDPLTEAEVWQRFTTLLQGYDQATVEQLWARCGSVTVPGGVESLIGVLARAHPVDETDR